MYDLPIALGILCESGQLPPTESFLIACGLSLNGKLRPIKGAPSIAIAAKKDGFKSIILPAENAAEAAIISDIYVYGFADLGSVIRFLNGEKAKPTTHHTRGLFIKEPDFKVDFPEVNGQLRVKPTLEIAAAGNHHVLLIGPPGSGKIMLACRLPAIMPPMDLHEAPEVTRIYSVAGLLQTEGLMPSRPFRSPHHTLSDIALVGGGTTPQPGEISLAHQGVLFLDELPEFKRKALEVLRQPLEERLVSISRANYNNVFPAGFLFVAAMNPCRITEATDPKRRVDCPHCGQII